MRTSSRREFLLCAGITVSSVAASSRLLGEAFSSGAIPTAPDKASINANSLKEDVLSDVRESASDPSEPRETMRGLMVDAGRVPESMAYYSRVIEFCADWQLNTLHFRIADDQGSALRFASVPDLLTHNNAFTPEELKGLAQYAKSHGVELLPELESFGHTGYITRSPAYAHLLDRSAQGSSEFTGVIPVNPETLQLFEKLYQEIATIFQSPHLHAGCDEVNWGGSALSRKALKAKTRAQIWAGYLNSLNQISESLGKQLIVWGDFVLHKEPEILSRLKKNIIIMDWNYWENSSAKIQETYLKIRANGSRAIGAPALIRYIWGPRAGSEQLRNIDAYAEAYLGSNDPSSLGVILTNWVPSRYIQNSLWDGFAYAAVAFNHGTATAQNSGLRRFVERHYQSKWNETWDEVFHLMYDNAPYVEDRESSSWMGLRLPIPWSDDGELTALLKEKVSPQNPFTRLRSLLVLLEPSVLENFSDFQAFALCVEYLENAFWREAIVIEHAASQPITRETAREVIQNIADRDQALKEALSRDWDKGRPADSTAKLEPLYGLAAKDQLLFQWRRAADYSASLANNPERFYQFLLKARSA